MYELASGAWLTPHGHQVTLEYRRDTNDWNSISSTLAPHDEYHLPSGLSGNALDVGGYLGSVGIALALDNPDLQVVIVEPVPPNAELIRQNIRLNNLTDRVSLIEGAVGGGAELIDVWYGYRGSESLEHHAFVGNSTLAYDHGGDAEHDTATYVAHGLAEFTPISFLKIDCEGGEWEFLASPDLDQVETIVGEWHPVRGHTLADMRALLEATHDVTFDGPEEGPGGFRAVRR